MLIFRSKKCARTQTSNYVKFEILINQSSIATLKWDLALETTARVTTRDNATQREYVTSATRHNTSTTRNDMRQQKYNMRQHEYNMT